VRPGLNSRSLLRPGCLLRRKPEKAPTGSLHIRHRLSQSTFRRSGKPRFECRIEANAKRASLYFRMTSFDIHR
jgi:hypothetical protein